MTANLWQLFLSFMQVGMFSIGGGYAAMPFIRSQVVSLHGWLTMSEFTDLVTIAEMTPGPIAINAATFVGNRLAGFTGAIVATMGCILPSCLIVSLLAYLYRKYRQMDMLQNVLTCLRPAVVALIASAGLEILRQVIWPGGVICLSEVDVIGLVMAVAAFIVLRWRKWNPILVMLLCGAARLGIGLIIG